jgi:putative ABC transport system permease protein
MLPPRWRKILRDLSRAKLRTALVVLSIAVGIFAIGTIAATRIMLSEDLTAGYAATNPASATLFPGGFDQDLVRMVRRMDGIADAEGKRRASVRVKTGPDAWRTLRLEVTEDLAAIRLNKIGLERGAWPVAKGEIAVERSTIGFLEAAIGDEITVETPDNKHHQLRITGITHDNNKPPAIFSGTIYGYTTFDTFDLLRFPKTYSELHILVADQKHDRAHVQTITDQVKRRLENTGRNVTWTYIPKPGEHPANEIVQTFLLILGVLGGIALLLSGFLVVNTISAVLAQQIPQIGVMKAVGARTNQLVGMYLGSVLVYGLLALFAAIPIGALGAYAFTSYLAGLINYNPTAFRIPAEVLLLEVTVALVVPVCAALWPVLAGARVTVLEAINASGGRGTFGTSLLDRFIVSLSTPSRVAGRRWPTVALPRPLLLSLRSTFRRKARLALTLFTLTLGGAIFIAVLSVHASLAATLDEALAYWQYDVGVNFTQPRRVEQIVEEVKRVPGVVDAEPWRFASSRRLRPDGREGPDMELVAPPAETRLITPILLRGRWLQPDDTNAVIINSEVLKEEPDLTLGSAVTLKINGKETDWQVVGVVKAVMSGPTVYVNLPYFAEITHSIGRANRVQVITESHDAATHNRMARTLKEHLDDNGLKVSGTSTISANRQNVESQFNILVVFLAIMAVLLAVVGGLGLMGTMSINVLERSREIGVMRAIGASNGAVLQIFLVEGILIGALSWIAGSILSLPISRLLSDLVGNAFMRHPLTYAFSGQGAAMWLAVVVALAALASFFPAYRAARLTVREVLAYE